MKLEKLIIYGFGRHENLTIDLNAPMTVFYGPNEAGKTTIQQFIIQLLFGFSSRGQAHRRYEPKAGGKYGGQLHLADPEHGKVIVERTAGKSAGQVELWFEDGQRGGEQELVELLKGYDRASYEAIFAFSVHELQDLDSMTEQELTRTLLASGTAGVDHAGKMESRLEREMGELFKKSGKLPLLNRLSKELRQLEQELRESKERADKYRPATERLEQIKRRLNEIKHTEQQLSGRIKEMEKWQQAAPLLARKKEVEELREDAGDAEFPENGVRKYENLLERKNEEQAEAAFLENEWNRLPQEPEAPETAELSFLLDQEPEWHQLVSSIKLKQEDCTRLEDEAARLLTLCGMTRDQALQADVSLDREEQLKRLAEAVQAHEQQQAFQKRRVAEERERLLEAEQELKQYLENEPAEEQRRQAEEWEQIAPQLVLAKAGSKQSGSMANNKAAIYLIAAIGVVSLIIALVSSDIFAGILGMSAVAAADWLWRQAGSKQAVPQEEELLKRYEKQRASYEALAEMLLQYDKGLDARLEDVEQSKRTLAKWRSETKTDELEAYKGFLENIGFPSNTSSATVLTLFEKLRELQAAFGRRDRIENELEALEIEQQKWLERVASACGRPVTADGAMAVLRSEWSSRQHKLQQLEKVRDKRQQLGESLRKCHERLAALSQAIEELFERAQAGDEAAFYRSARRVEQAHAASDELKLIDSQLAAIGETAEPEEQLLANGAEEFLAASHQAVEQLEAERSMLLEEQADKQQQTRHLLSDANHAMKLQELEVKKAEFQDAAKEWAVNRAIVEAFRQTMDELKETKLPAVLSLAESYFERLSGGEYSRLMLTPSGNFEALRRDGLRFRIIELSQATKEQAYLALRFALASSLKQSHPFPIIMDDPFVHFDRGRREQVIKLVEELQGDHQFIYFTCHETMRSAWPKAQQIDVANPERSIHI